MRKSIIATAALGALALGSGAAIAASTNVDASVNINQTAIEIFTERGITFGGFDITNANASGTINISSADTLSVDATGIVHDGNGGTGVINVTGTPGAGVEFTCTTTALLVHETDTTQTLDVSQVELEGSACSTGVISGTLGTNALRWDVGGVLTFDSPIVGAYSTANPGGTPITVDVVYQ